MRRLSEADRERIDAAIRRAESETSTEIVVLLLPRSASYRFYRLFGAFGWTLAMQLVLARAFEAHPFWLVLVAPPIAAVTYAIFSVPSLTRLLVPRAYAARRVEERAFQEFAQRGIHNTRDRTGMLILISELEHRVVILGDSAIHKQVGKAGWDAHVAHIIRAIRRGDLATGVVEVVEQLGVVHAKHLPPRPDDTNELPNVIVGDK